MGSSSAPRCPTASSIQQPSFPASHLDVITIAHQGVCVMAQVPLADSCLLTLSPHLALFLGVPTVFGELCPPERYAHVLTTLPPPTTCEWTIFGNRFFAGVTKMR